MKKINWQYAFGEIIIVIIGISVAFALNNWRDNQAKQKIKTQYIENLILDVQEEIKQLDTNEIQITSKIKNLDEVLNFMIKKEGNKNQIVGKVFESARHVTFNPENTTYYTLINSGDMKLIDNFQLRRRIEAHYAGHKDVLQGYERLENINAKHLGNFFIYDMDYDKLRKGDLSFLENPLLKNILNSTRGAYYLVAEVNKDCYQSNSKLLKALEKELNN